MAAALRHEWLIHEHQMRSSSSSLNGSANEEMTVYGTDEHALPGPEEPSCDAGDAPGDNALHEDAGRHVSPPRRDKHARGAIQDPSEAPHGRTR